MSQINIKFERLGKITQGDDLGHTVKVISDKENTGGFLVLVSKDKSPNSGWFDSWVENRDCLESYFKESNWSIEWRNSE